MFEANFSASPGRISFILFECKQKSREGLGILDRYSLCMSSSDADILILSLVLSCILKSLWLPTLA
jgi:hypothetical protein